MLARFRVRMLPSLLLRHERRRGMRVENLERLYFLIRHRREREVRVFPLLRIALDLHIHAAQPRPSQPPIKKPRYKS